MDPHLGFYIVTSISVSGNLKLETFITHAVIVSYHPFIMLTQYVIQVGANPGYESLSGLCGVSCELSVKRR
jgi:hypothetical protein